MTIRRCLNMLSLLLTALGFLTSGRASAQDNAPIIARAGNRLYAVSATTGESRLLDEVPLELDEVLRKHYAGSGIRLDSVSPDNSHAAYTAAVSDLLDPAHADLLKPLAQRAPNDVYVVDVSSGQRSAITSQAVTFADAVAGHAVQHYSDLTWSLDGSRLYFVAESRSLDDQPTIRILHYYDLVSGSLNRVADLLPPPLTVDNSLIGLYPVSAGIAQVTALDYNGNFRFVLFAEDNTVINQFEVQLMGTQDVNAWMFDYNPIRTSEGYGFGYYTVASDGPKPNTFDLGTGTGQPAHNDVDVITVSRAAAGSSLQIVLDPMLMGAPQWSIASQDGNKRMTLDTALFITDSAISPDGQSVAYLDKRVKTGEPRDIIIFDGSTSRSLAFAADEIMWGSVEYAFK